MLLLVIFSLSGCSSSSGDKVLTSVAVQPADNRLAIGKTQQFKVICSFSDGTTSSDLPVIWSSSSTSVATITPDGMASAVSVGQTTITATVGGASVTTTLTVPLPPPVTLNSISITPASQTIAAGTIQEFSATGTYSDNSTQDLTKQVTWSSDNSSVAAIAQDGRATAYAAGSAMITASLGSVSAIVALAVSPATLDSITVTPSSPGVAAGTIQQFNAIGAFSDSTTQDLTASVTWSSGNNSVATITQDGKATTYSPGSTSITATLGSKSASSALTVTPATLVSLVVTPSNPSIAAGMIQQFSATGIYSDNTSQDLTKQVTWSTSSASIAGISQDGKATTVAAGTATISAASGGMSGSQELVVTPRTVTAAGTWEGTYTIYDAYDPKDIGTYTFKLVLTQSGTSVNGTSSLRYNTVGQLQADGKFKEGNVTDNQIDFVFTYIDSRYSREMVNIGTATFSETSMTGNVIENFNGGYNCSYVFSLKKL